MAVGAVVSMEAVGASMETLVAVSMAAVAFIPQAVFRAVAFVPL
jgi:hypothetical protein